MRFKMAVLTPESGISFYKMQKKSPEVLYKKAVLKNLAVLTGKYWCLIQNIVEFLVHLFRRTTANGCFCKCVHQIEENLELFIRNFNLTLKMQDFPASISETNEDVCFYFMIGFLWSLYSHTIFL